MDNNSSVAVILVVSTALFASIGFIQSALASVTRETIFLWRNENRRGTEKLESLFRKADQSASAFSILKALTLSGSLVAANMWILKENPWNWGTVLVATVCSLLILGIVETLTRTLARPKGPTIAVFLYGFAAFIAAVLSPVTRSQERIAEIGSSSSEEDQGASNGATSIAMQLDDRGEPLEEHEVRMIRGVFQLDKTIAREIMIPRVDMESAEVTTSLDDVADLMLKAGHSKIPVYREELDNIEGIAHSMDVLRFMSDANGTRAADLSRYLRPVLYVPESKTLEDLLTEFQEKRMQMAIVIDEYGGVSGLVTVEDLVEEIVGELHDEFDTGEPEMKKINESEFLMDAGVSIDDLTETLRISFEGEGFDTIGGFVLHQLGRIPSAGDTVEYNGLRIEVISRVGRRLKSIRVRRV